ncbi:MAG: helix-turn-helix domain-containing protein [Phycisphaeraceae bacterium]|nr:helix-turn-helix domain-containing protein [Phycisphaeraceae bacterium]
MVKRLKLLSEPAQERGALAILQDLKQGAGSPHDLSTQDRRVCVMHLGAEGLSIAEIAKILGVSERTILRDRRVNQEENALQHDPRLAGQMAGRLVAEAELAMQRIRRVTRDTQTPPAVRVEGEKACFGICHDAVARLQSLGFLPTATQRFEADICQTAEAIPTYGQIEEEVQLLLTAADSTGDSQEVHRIQELNGLVSRARIVEQVREAKTALTAGQGQSHDDPA